MHLMELKSATMEVEPRRRKQLRKKGRGPLQRNQLETTRQGVTLHFQTLALQSHPPLYPPQPPIPEIELVFRPHPEDEQHDTSGTRYIKTTANASGWYLVDEYM